MGKGQVKAKSKNLEKQRKGEGAEHSFRADDRFQSW